MQVFSGIPSGDVIWGPGESYAWELADAHGTPGAGWDWLNFAGNLSITATNHPDDGQKFTIAISGAGLNFDNMATNSWIIATVGGTVNQFNANKFIVTTGGFTPSLGGGTFSVVLRDKSVALVFTPAAPPCSATTSASAAVEGTVMVMTFINESRLGSVQALVKENCTIVGKEYSDSAMTTNSGTAITGNIELDVRTTLLGTTKKVVLWASKTIPGNPATVNVMAIDTCGRGKSFDPVVTTLQVTAGGRVQQRFAGILAAERYLRVINGNPGLSRLEIVLNGHLFRLHALATGQNVAVDLGAAMNEGDANVVVLTGFGETGASALVLITDQPADDLVQLPEVAELALVPSDGKVVISWPEVLTGWQLQSSASAESGWQNVATTSVTSDGQRTVTVDASGTAQFFRLHAVRQASRPPPSIEGAGAVSARATASGDSADRKIQILQRSYDGIIW